MISLAQQRRVAIVHSFYGSASPSGENSVVMSEVEALARAGHEIALFDARTDELQRSLLDTARSGLRVTTGRGRSPLRELREFAPEVVHVHNLFPNFGRAWVRKLEVPLVATLHNYRQMCANGLLFRDGAICMKCPRGRRFAGVRHRCYRNSALASLPLALANRPGASNDALLSQAAALVSVSDVIAAVYAEAGLDRSKILVWPNFLRDDLDPGPPGRDRRREGWLYVGRVSAEKGILDLAVKWPRNVPLMVVGGGPLWGRLQEIATSNAAIELVGMVDRATVMDYMNGSLGLVFPGLSLEACPLVYVEALAAGLPVLAWEPNAVAGFVRTDGTGMALTWHADLPAVLEEADASFPQLGRWCREVFESRMSERAHVERATALYQTLAGRSTVRS